MRIAVLLLLLSAWPLGAAAQDLLGLYQQALESDAQLRAARATRDAGHEAVPLARSALLPNLSASADLTYQDQDVKASLAGASHNRFASNGANLTLVQPLFHKDRWVALDQAEDQVQQADANLAIAEQGMISRVAQAYFGVLSAQDSLKFAQAEKAAIARQLEQAKERFEVGLVAITDVHEAQARFDQARANEISALNAVDAAHEALREIVADADTQVAGMKADVPLVPPTPASIDEWSAMAQQHNPGILAAKLSSDIAHKQIDAKYAGHYPQLDLVGNLNRTRSNAPSGTDVDTASIGLQVSIPLYSGGGVTAATRQARHQYLAAEETLDQQRRAVARQVRDAYRSIHTSISRVQALAATVHSAESALEATEAGFEAGTRTLVDVLNSQRDLFRAKRDYAQSRYDYVLGTIGLLQAAGTLSKADIERVNAWLN